MVDILFPVHNRLEFTKVAADALAKHTNKSLVQTVYVYDDNSEDGAGQVAMNMLRHAFSKVVEVYSFQGFGGPVAIMNDYIRQSTVEMFAKVDNDTVVCPQWLDICVDVMARSPDLDLLGIEPYSPVVKPGEPLPYERGSFEARFIGGIGLMRMRAFRQAMKPLVQTAKYFGFTSWQTEHEHVKKGWLDPAMNIILLDRIPTQPWASLSAEYIAKGWQRPYGMYLERDAHMWEHIKFIH